MTTLLLARHGETDWNRELRIQGSSDIELNELGRRQAQLARPGADRRRARRDLRERPQPRARDGGRRRRRHGLDVKLDPRLRERSFGCWEGLTREDIARLLPEASRHDGESDDEVRERMLEAQAIAAAHPASRCSSSRTAAR